MKKKSNINFTQFVLLTLLLVFIEDFVFNLLLHHQHHMKNIQAKLESLC